MSQITIRILLGAIALLAIARPVAADTAPEVSSNMQVKKVRPPAYRRDFITLVPEIGAGPSGFAISGDVSASQVSSATGFRGSFLTEIGRDLFSFQTGVTFQQEGVALGTANTQSAIAVDEIGVPLLAKLNLTGEGQRRFTFKLGAVPMYAANVTSVQTATDSSGVSGTVSGRDDLRSINVLGEAGVGFEVPIARGNDVRFELIYDHSTLPINMSSGSVQIYSQSFMLVIGLGIGV